MLAIDSSKKAYEQAEQADTRRSAESTASATARIPADGAIPHEVVQLSFNNGWSLIRAWREYLGVTQTEMAARLGIRQPSYLAMEAAEAKPKKATKQRIADALGILYDQLDA